MVVGDFSAVHCKRTALYEHAGSVIAEGSSSNRDVESVAADCAAVHCERRLIMTIRVTASHASSEYAVRMRDRAAAFTVAQYKMRISGT